MYKMSLLPEVGLITHSESIVSSVLVCGAESLPQRGGGSVEVRQENISRFFALRESQKDVNS